MSRAQRHGGVIHQRHGGGHTPETWRGIYTRVAVDYSILAAHFFCFLTEGVLLWVLTECCCSRCLEEWQMQTPRKSCLSL